MKIYIIRHGETDLNVQGVMQGWLDEPLNQNGRDLAEITGRAMQDVHFDCCISSPLIRSTETVEIVLRESGNDIPVFTDDRLKEIYFGDIEGESLSVLGDEGEIFHDDPFSFKGFPNGECVQDVCRRTQEFLKELIARDDDKTYLIGIHGCALRAMLNFLYEDPSEYWHGHVPYNCAVNIVEAKDGVARLVADDMIYYPSELAIDRYKKENMGIGKEKACKREEKQNVKEVNGMADNTNIWKSGIMGVVVGDALGCPVQFRSREEVARHPVTGMRGYGTFNLPEGSWTDDSSLTIATLESIRRKKKVDLDDIMENFMKWLYEGEFTPYGESFDIGFGTRSAINRYHRYRKAGKCGGEEESNNGNGSLMRILPVCIYCSQMLQQGAFSEKVAVETVHGVGGLTHAHIRSNIGCGLYFFMVHEILTGAGTLQERLQAGATRGFAFYESYLADKENLRLYDRLQNLETFAETSSDQIKNKGYVLFTLEAAVWALITTDTLEQALLKVVNLGDDTDTSGAVAGGLAGLYYGYDAIPEDWLKVIKRRDWIEELCTVEL